MKVIQTNEEEKLTVKQIVSKFNDGKLQVYNTLKANSGIKAVAKF
jgi:hypothetical protein